MRCTLKIKTLTTEDWNDLIEKISKKQCTPFIGAGACYGVLPLAKKIASRWAKSHNYLLDDKKNLAKISEYLAVMHDDIYPKNNLQKEFANKGPPDFLG